MNDALRNAIERAVDAGGAVRWQRLGATGWGEAWRIDAPDSRAFVKTAAGRFAPMLECEADGLRALRATRTLRVPQVLASGVCTDAAYIAMEWLEFAGGVDGEALGHALAALHRAAAPRGPQGERFGWSRSNWIGGTPQANDWRDDWCAFFGDCRLAPQFALAVKNGHALRARGDQLLEAVRALLRDHAPAPSLVHGDLWSGNVGTLFGGEPVAFDPALYVGDREVDVAMSELFGGFPRAFYPAYRDAWPLDPGYPLRRDLYNLYHLLNHLNLFGAGYLRRVEQTIDALLRSVG